MPYKDIHLFNRSTVSAIMNLASLWRPLKFNVAEPTFKLTPMKSSYLTRNVIKASAEQAQSMYSRQELQHGTKENRLRVDHLEGAHRDSSGSSWAMRVRSHFTIGFQNLWLPRPRCWTWPNPGLRQWQYMFQ